MGGEADILSVFLVQAEACEKLGSPFTGMVCRLLARLLRSESEIGRIVFGWQGNPAPGADSVPLRLCGALNHLVVTGADGALGRLYPPASETPEEAALAHEIERVLEEHAGHVAQFLKSAPQTNEVRRSVALLPGWLWLAAHYGKPLAISEVGASAGLNLFSERYLLKTETFLRGKADSSVILPTSWRGDVPPDTAIEVADRAGCDLAPIDPADRNARERLISYVWPDQRDRVERISAAIETAMASGAKSPVEKADAADWLERRLRRDFDGAVHVVQHTIAWQYFPEAVKARGEAALAQAGARATNDRPLARLMLEADGNSPGAAISLTLWPGGETHALGRADYHGQWIEWRNPAV